LTVEPGSIISQSVVSSTISFGLVETRCTITRTGLPWLLFTTTGKLDSLATRVMSDPPRIETPSAGTTVLSAGNAGIAANPIEAAIATIRTIVIFFNFEPR
jgi:hypothetical protein